jgi:hypothetical protein
MAESMGRHRRRRQRKGSRARWWLAALLSLMLSRPQTARRQAKGQAPRDTRPQRHSGAPVAERVPSTRPPAQARAADEPGWISNYRAVSSQRSTSWAHAFDNASPEAGVVPASRRPRGVERGWCVDDTGIRAVRPYLVRHEEHVARLRERAPQRAVHSEPRSGGRHQAAPVPVDSGDEKEEAGEFDELARLVRQ